MCKNLTIGPGPLSLSIELIYLYRRSRRGDVRPSQAAARSPGPADKTTSVLEKHICSSSSIAHMRLGLPVYPFHQGQGRTRGVGVKASSFVRFSVFAITTDISSSNVLL